MKTLPGWDLSYDHIETILSTIVDNECVPIKKNVLRSLELVKSLAHVKVVILGQDPYPDPRFADGLAFSCGSKDGPLPHSLRNIFAEIKRDVYFNADVDFDRSLEWWAEQGVLLLNTTLTTAPYMVQAHRDKGWEAITQDIIFQISEKNNHVVFMLWGKEAQKAEQYINKSKHYVMKTSHPSPLSVNRGFRGCGHFGNCNQYLIATKQSPIQWKKKWLMPAVVGGI